MSLDLQRNSCIIYHYSSSRWTLLLRKKEKEELELLKSNMVYMHGILSLTYLTKVAVPRIFINYKLIIFY